jgi:hypothetical protein
MSTPLQPIWLIHPIEPPTEPVLVVQEPLTELIPVPLPRHMGTGQVLPAARRPVPQSRPSRQRNIVAVILMLGLLLGGVTAVISAFLDGATTERTSTSSSR